MIILNILKGLSLCSGEKLLLEEGYTLEECIEQNHTECDKLFLYPYCLYDTQGKRLDCIYFAEYCNYVMDDEYVDGRMTWEPMRAEWIRDNGFTS